MSVSRVAAGLSVLLVLGIVIASGSATTALWKADATVSGLTIESGDLKVERCSDDGFFWEETATDVMSPSSGVDPTDLFENYRWMPGDILRVDYCVEATVKGDNLAALFTLDWELPDGYSDDAGLYRAYLDGLGLSTEESRWTIRVIDSPAGWEPWVKEGAPNLWTPVSAAVDPSVRLGVPLLVGIPAVDQTGANAPASPEERTFRWVVSVSLNFMAFANNWDFSTSCPELKPECALPPVVSPASTVPAASPHITLPTFVLRADQTRSEPGLGFD
ncbi:MAG: hypothetical protein FWD59_07950 [Micrococcales bacterium]|nr:hypothetical protein [Micrococcales bacterium]